MTQQPKDSEQTARRFHAEGISFLMVKADGSKSPIESWERWQDEQTPECLIGPWFGGGKRRGVGMICGQISGNLEVIDLDAPELVEDFEAAIDYAFPRTDDATVRLRDRLVIVKTPKGGRHYIYRCETPVQGNQKLARREGPDGNIQCLIETRGEGGYVVAPGSPAKCHKLNLPYVLVQGHYSNIPVISAEDRDALLASARYFNTYEDPEPSGEGEAGASKSRPGPRRPGDDFSDHATMEWVARILIAGGWSLGYVSRRGHQQWTRPGKGEGDGTSATLFQSKVFHVFSSNAHPFDPDKSYAPFDVLALLAFGGDFAACAKSLAKKGYGSPDIRRKTSCRNQTR